MKLHLDQKMFKDAVSITAQDSYLIDFKPLVFRILPSEELIVNSLKYIKSKIDKVDWNLKK